MKKIITVAVAFTVCALSVVFAADGLQSANVVGWSDKPMKDDYQAFAPFFFTVGQNSVRLSDLAVVDRNTGKPPVCSGNMNLQTLTSVGNCEKLYRWVSGQPKGSQYEVDGWYTLAGDLVKGDDVVFQNGQGVWVKSFADYAIKMAGEVLLDDVKFELHNDYQMLANPFATKIKLRNLRVVKTANNDEVPVVSGTINLQTLTSVGNCDKLYRWVSGQPGGQYAVDGWYTLGGDLVGDDVEFEPGLGVWVKGLDGCSIIMETPLEK